jgi:hypothetical protein
MDEQLARVRFLSSRFAELQGLRVALAGAALAFVFGSYLMSGHPTHMGGMIALAASFLLMVPGQWWASRYYATTVGRQVASRRSWWPKFAFVSAYLLVATFLNWQFPEIPAGAPTAGTVVLMSLFVAIRDWPWRAHYAVVAAVVATAFSMNVIGVDVIDRGMTLTMTFFVTGLAFIPAGLLDHRLLMKLIEESRRGLTAGTSA